MYEHLVWNAKTLAFMNNFYRLVIHHLLFFSFVSFIPLVKKTMKLYLFCNHMPKKNCNRLVFV